MTIEQLEAVAKNVAADLGITVEQARSLMRVAAKQYLSGRGKK